jgi:hypothetical protein
MKTLISLQSNPSTSNGLIRAAISTNHSISESRAKRTRVISKQQYSNL